jgi:NTE family protein
MKGLNWAVGGLLAVLLCGCASLSAEPNRPLETAIHGPAYRITTIPDGTSRELFVALAFSGGGKRSSAFGYGVLTALREITVDFGDGRRRLTDEIDVVTGVSGGSFTASAFALKRDAMFETYKDEFLKYDLNAEIFGIYLMPWRWDWLVNPNWGTNDEMARVYDELLFKGADYGDLAQLGRPFLGVQATDFANEEPFVFGQDTFDWICSDITTLPMARAVAASNGFPVLFTPISLRNYAHDDEHACKRPAWVDPYLAIPDELSRRRQLALLASSYLDKRDEAYVHLLDGGVSDNLGLRGLMQMLAPTTEEATLDAESLNKLRHVLIVSVDGQAEPDRQMTEVPYLDSVFRVIGAVTSTAIDRYGFETLIVHLSLSDIADDENRTALAAIPTGLTIADQDVEALIAAGRDAALCDGDMRDFFKSLPNVQMPEMPKRCRVYRPWELEAKASAPNNITARESRADNP